MDTIIGLSYICHERSLITPSDLEYMELEDFFLMLKNHKAVMTPEGVHYLFESYDMDYILECNDLAAFLDSESFKEDLEGLAVEDLETVPILSEKNIYNFLTGRDTDYSFKDTNFLFEDEDYIIDDDKMEAILEDIYQRVDSIDFDTLSKYWNNYFYILSDFDVEVDQEDYTIHDVLFHFRDSKKNPRESFIDLRNSYKEYRSLKNKPLKERIVPDETMTRILECYHDREETLTDTEKETYKAFLDILMEHNDPHGLHIAAYAYYGDNAIVGIDYSISEKCLLELLKIHYDARYANTLGYIYYYGRVNNGVPQYDLAYKYYTMASLTGEVEARYKLGDMYRNGFYVEKNLEVAKQTYDNLRGDALNEFYNDPKEASLADVFFRIGMMHEDGEDISDIWASAESYLLALCAIQIRNGKFDASVKQGITNKLISLYDKHKAEILEIHPLYNGIRQMKDIKVTIDHSEKGNVMVTFKNKIKVLIPDYHGMNCIYSDEVQVHFDGELIVPIAEDTPIDEIYENEDDDYVFYSEGVLVGKISKSNVKLIMDTELVDIDVDKSEYKVIVCQYTKGEGKKYSYILEGEEKDFNLEWIVVETGKQVYPIECKSLKGYELPVPISKMKHVKCNS